MKKIYIISLLALLVVPLISFAQYETNSKTLTPYADVSFANGKIIYSIDRKYISFTSYLLPKLYDKAHFTLRFIEFEQIVNDKYIKGSLESIREFLKKESVEIIKSKEEEEYLKLCVLIIIVDNELESQIKKNLIELSNSENKEVNDNSQLVIDFLKIYETMN